ncbi:MFS transporter [Gordonia sp. NB41Y]|uniref:MFS transporter n=1 Tax=Gordonia sp. NB41Y TaxID=875808 RepID=UPI0006B1A8FB|nr:MFS transporter [Gordonia sp. NB41Y]WLP90618.1 MFS transporter [Gordonia sp. NB41Y]
MTWAVGAVAYLVAITNRTSLSALGIDTAHHFSIDPATLSLFAVIQLGVYGVAQIPVGMALDRYGSKAVLTVGLGLMALSQIALALAPSVWIAIAARVLLGAGDAAVFPCVLRIIGIRFPRRVAPLMVQVTAMIGQAGQIVSIVPFTHLVHSLGWQPGFLLLAATCVLMAVLAVVLVSDGHSAPTARSATDSTATDGDGDITRDASDEQPGTLARLRESLAEPGTRLAFWTHAVSPFSTNMFGVLWGFPFLVTAENLVSGTAQMVLITSVIIGVAAGPVVGVFSARFAPYRVHLVLVLVAGQLIVWSVVLAFSGPAPTWLLYVLAIAIGAGGPASVLAFDFARDHNPVYRLSTATGVVNAGGFFASVVVILLIGLTLGIMSGGQTGADAYDLTSFRVAMAWQIPFWLLGATMVWREYRKTLGNDAESAPALTEVDVPDTPVIDSPAPDSPAPDSPVTDSSVSGTREPESPVPCGARTPDHH